MFLNQRDQYGFFQIINNVSGYYAEFRSKMTFRDDILSDAQKTFDTLNEKNKCSKKTKCTVVYVHMRMADYTHHMEALNLGPDVFNKTNYLQEAFKHVDQNHKVNAAKPLKKNTREFSHHQFKYVYKGGASVLWCTSYVA